MRKVKNHSPVDITFKYKVKEFDRINNFWSKNKEDESEFVDLLMLLAMYGLKNKSRISLEQDDGLGEKRTIARVVYNRQEVKMESIIGMVNILSPHKYSNEKMLNEIAFAKMNTHNLPFLKLENMRTFYEYMLGGISFLYDDLFSFGSDLSQVVLALTDLVLDDEDDYTAIIDAMLLEESGYLDYDEES